MPCFMARATMWGVIVFPADAEQPQLDEPLTQIGQSTAMGRHCISADSDSHLLDEMERRFSQMLALFLRNFFTTKRLFRIANSCPDYDPRKELIGAYAIGHYFKVHYSADSKEFSEQSLCIEVDGLSTQPLLYLGAFACRVFGQQLVLIGTTTLSRFIVPTVPAICPTEMPGWTSSSPSICLTCSVSDGFAATAAVVPTYITGAPKPWPRMLTTTSRRLWVRRCRSGCCRASTDKAVMPGVSLCSLPMPSRVGTK